MVARLTMGTTILRCSCGPAMSSNLYPVKDHKYDQQIPTTKYGPGFIYTKYVHSYHTPEWNDGTCNHSYYIHLYPVFASYHYTRPVCRMVAPATTTFYLLGLPVLLAIIPICFMSPVCHKYVQEHGHYKILMLMYGAYIIHYICIFMTCVHDVRIRPNYHIFKWYPDSLF
jgi:hypothetical protein